MEEKKDKPIAPEKVVGTSGGGDAGEKGPSAVSAPPNPEPKTIASPSGTAPQTGAPSDWFALYMHAHF